MPPQPRLVQLPKTSTAKFVMVDPDHVGALQPDGRYGCGVLVQGLWIQTRLTYEEVLEALWPGPPPRPEYKDKEAPKRDDTSSSKTPWWKSF